MGGFVALIPSLSLFIGSVILALYGVYLLIETIYKALTAFGELDSTVLATKFISIMDIYLLSVVLYIFAVGLYELFVEKIESIPEWLRIESIDDLKAKLSSVIVLILAITFTKNFVSWQKPVDTLLFGIAGGIVIFALIFYYKVKEGQ